MIQVKLTKDSRYGKKNQVRLVTGNVAHSIIDGGFGKIYKRRANVYRNRMMESSAPKGRVKRTYGSRRKVKK